MQTAETWPNLVEMFFDQASRRGKRAMLHAKVDGAWRTTTWAMTSDL